MSGVVQRKWAALDAVKAEDAAQVPSPTGVLVKLKDGNQFWVTDPFDEVSEWVLEAGDYGWINFTVKSSNAQWWHERASKIVVRSAEIVSVAFYPEESF